MLSSLIRMAETLDALGRQPEAAQVFGAAEAICERLGMSMATALTTTQIPGDVPSSSLRDEIASRISQRESDAWGRVILADPALASHWAAGRRLTSTSAIAEALAIGPEPPPNSHDGVHHGHATSV